MPSVLSKSLTESCQVIGHQWECSCTRSILEIFYYCMRYSLEIYTPLYVVTAVLNRRSKEYFKKKIIWEILQSSMFLASNGGFMVAFFCLFRKLLGRFYFLSAGILPGFFSSLAAILIERKSRRGALAIYMLNQGFDTAFNILKSYGLVKHVEYGEVVIFMLTMGVLMYMYRSDNLPDGIVKKIFDYFLKKQNKHIVSTGREEKLKYSYYQECIQQAGRNFCIGYGVQSAINLLLSLKYIFSKPDRLFKALVRKQNLQLGAFLSSLVGIFRVLEKLLAQHSKSHANAFIAGTAAGVSMMFQRSSYIALYLLSKTCELVYFNGIEKGLVPYVKHFDSILYASCTALMFHGAVLQPLYLRGAYWNFLLQLTGNKFLEVNRYKLDHFGIDSSKIDRLMKEGLPTHP